MNINLTLLLDLITFFILLVLLQKFVYRPLLQLMDKRRDSIEKNLLQIQRLKEESTQDREKAAQELQEAKESALRIKDEAFVNAEEYREKKRIESEKESKEERKKAKEEISLLLEKAKEQLQRYSLDLSFTIAEKILKEKINREEHDKLLEDGLKKLYDKRDYNL